MPFNSIPKSTIILSLLFFTSLQAFLFSSNWAVDAWNEIHSPESNPINSTHLLFVRFFHDAVLIDPLFSHIVWTQIFGFFFVGAFLCVVFTEDKYHPVYWPLVGIFVGACVVTPLEMDLVVHNLANTPTLMLTMFGLVSLWTIPLWDLYLFPGDDVHAAISDVQWYIFTFAPVALYPLRSVVKNKGESVYGSRGVIVVTLLGLAVYYTFRHWSLVLVAFQQDAQFRNGVCWGSSVCNEMESVWDMAELTVVAQLMVRLGERYLFSPPSTFLFLEVIFATVYVCKLVLFQGVIPWAFGLVLLVCLLPVVGLVPVFAGYMALLVGLYGHKEKVE